MSGIRTFNIIKPDAFEASYTGPIIEKIEEAGFKILNMRLERLDQNRAGKFYEVHNDKPFLERLCNYMCSGPIVVMELEKSNAVEDFRKLIGATNPENAEKGTIRNQFALNIQENSVHGSDSEENAKIEIDYFFNESEIYS